MYKVIFLKTAINKKLLIFSGIFEQFFLLFENLRNIEKMLITLVLCTVIIFYKNLKNLTFFKILTFGQIVKSHFFKIINKNKNFFK